MSGDHVVLIHVQNLERETVYFNAGDLEINVGDSCVVEHGGLRLGVMMGELEAGAGLGEQLESVVRIATPSDIDTYRYNQADA